MIITYYIYILYYILNKVDMNLENIQVFFKQDNLRLSLNKLYQKLLVNKVNSQSIVMQVSVDVGHNVEEEKIYFS